MGISTPKAVFSIKSYRLSHHVCQFEKFQRERLVKKLTHQSEAPGNTAQKMKTNVVEKAVCF